MTWPSDTRLSPMFFLDRFWRSRFLRFLFVGGINTLFSYLVYAAWLFLGFGYATANLLALILGVIFSFKTQGNFVFNNSDHGLFIRFVALWALLYGFSIMLIENIISLGFTAYEAGGLIILPNTLLSYLLQKYFVFGHNKRSGQTLIERLKEP